MLTGSDNSGNWWGQQLRISSGSFCIRGESSHHTNGSKAPRPAHFMLCGTLVVVEICGMIVSFMLSGMLVII